MEDDEDTIETTQPDVNSGEVISQSRISHDFLPTMAGEAEKLGELIGALGKEKTEYERAVKAAPWRITRMMAMVSRAPRWGAG